MELDPVDQRVLGSLLEKERTVPATYPLTLNALRSACNQTSGRDPITVLADHEVSASIDRLKALGLARIVHAGTGSRATKYRQVLDERLALDDAERAVLTLLLLRGAQTPGELRSRAERLHAFADSAEVERGLGSLRDRPEPLVAEHDRQPGQRERRWVHLLGPSPAPAVAVAAGAETSGDETEPARAPMGPWVAEPPDGWLLVRVAADEVDRTIDAVARAVGPASRLRLTEHSPDDILDVLALGQATGEDPGRLYALAPEATHAVGGDNSAAPEPHRD